MAGLQLLLLELNAVPRPCQRNGELCTEVQDKYSLMSRYNSKNLSLQLHQDGLHPPPALKAALVLESVSVGPSLPYPNAVQYSAPCTY